MNQFFFKCSIITRDMLSRAKDPDPGYFFRVGSGSIFFLTVGSGPSWRSDGVRIRVFSLSRVGMATEFSIAVFPYYFSIFYPCIFYQKLSGLIRKKKSISDNLCFDLRPGGWACLVSMMICMVLI